MGSSKILEVSIIETEEVKLNEPLFVLGFAGPGLVGGIAVAHIIEQLEMKQKQCADEYDYPRYSEATQQLFCQQDSCDQRVEEKV